MENKQCYCGSEKLFAECCEPILLGKQLARTPEELMRARFTAHCLRKYEFLVSSSHPEHRADVSVEEISSWAQHVQWEHLEIISSSPGENPDEGSVLFTAHYTVKGTPQELKEHAFFKKEGGQWFYVDGDVLGEEPYVRTSPKVGRNDACPCGSGKKYKKCCGAK